MTPGFQNMEDLLAQLLVPDTDGIDQATKTLHQLFATGEAVPMLCSVLQSSPSSQIRQYAAVLLRKRLGKPKHWKALPQNSKETIKSGIIPILVNEKEKTVKVSIVHFIAVICKHELKKGSWPEFSNFIQNLITSQNLTDVELGMLTMSTLTDIAPCVVEANPANIAVILNTVFQSLDDLNTVLGYYTATTMTHVASFCESNKALKEIFAKGIPKVITSFPALAAKNEERACELTDFFYEVLTGPKSLITPLLIPYVQFCLAMSTNRNLGDSIRDKMIALIGETVRAKKKLILKHDMVKPIVEVLFSIMCEPLDGVDNDDDENWFNDEDSEQPTHAATVMLGSMAINLPPMKLLQILTDHVLGNFNSENLYIRKACYLGLASVTEGAAECIRTNFLKPFVQCVIAGITDPSAAVRNAALFALGQFAVHLQPEVSLHHVELMPILFKYLGHFRQRLTRGGPDPPGVHSMFYAIETYCENLGEEDLAPYLPSLFEHLLVILDKRHSLLAQEQTISAIGAIASAAKLGVLPFFPAIIEKLKVYLITTPTEEEMHIQALALETLGQLIRTLGAEHFAPMAQETMSLGMELLKNVDDPGTRAAVYSLFGALSTVMKDDAAVFLPIVTERIYATLISTEGFMPVENEKAEPFCMFDNLSESENEGEEDIATESERSDDDDDDHLAVENDYMAEKYEACAALKDFAVHAENAFRPYLMKSFEELVKFYDNIHVAENKTGWFDALARICVNMSKIDTPEGKKVLEQSLKYFLMQCLYLTTTEEEYSVVNSALEAITTMVGEIGPAVIIAPNIPEMILNTVREVLTKKLPCQGRDDDALDDSDGEAEQDEVLVESACEILPALGKALNSADFSVGLEQLVPILIQKVTNEQCSESQKSFYIGTLAECISPVGDVMPSRGNLCATLYKLFIFGARDKFADVRNNSIFGLGELVKFGKQTLFSHYMEILQVFASTMVGETKPGVVDNICGALSKMIICNSSILPMEEIFPVMLDKLPLKEDFTENANVIECFNHLYQMGHPVLKNDITRVINNCCYILLEGKTADEVMWEVVKLLKSCAKDFPAEVNNVIGTLPPDSAKNITSALGS